VNFELHSLSRSRGANKNRKRVGRGPGSGNGVKAGRGDKGQKSRSGYSLRPGFEGGQMPLYRRLPKRGFFNKFSKHYVVMNVRDLEKYEDGTEVSPEFLLESGYVKSMKDGLRILGEGELTRKVSVKAHHVTESARKKIEDAGGSVEVVS